MIEFWNSYLSTHSIVFDINEWNQKRYHYAFLYILGYRKLIENTYLNKLYMPITQQVTSFYMIKSFIDLHSNMLNTLLHKHFNLCVNRLAARMCHIKTDHLAQTVSNVGCQQSSTYISDYTVWLHMYILYQHVYFDNTSRFQHHQNFVKITSKSIAKHSENLLRYANFIGKIVHAVA